MTRDTTIYIALLEEGTEVWRPARASSTDGRLFCICDAAPPGEHWEFQKGETVLCVERRFADGNAGLVAIEAVHV